MALARRSTTLERALRSRLRRAGAGALVLLLELAAPGRVHAELSRRVVIVDYAGAADEALARTVHELLARRDLESLGPDREAAVASRVLVRVTITRAKDVEGTHVVVRSAEAGAPVLLDRVVPHDPSAAIERERIALAVRGTAEAELVMAEERRAHTPTEPAPTPPPPEAPAAPPPAPPPAPAEPATPAPAPPAIARATDRAAGAAAPTWPVALDLATFAGVGVVGGGASAVAKVGGSVGVTLPRGLRPGAAIVAVYALPFDGGDGEVVSRNHLASLRLLPSIEPLHGRRFAIALGAGGGVDILRVDPTSDTLPAATLGDPTTRVDPIVSAAVTARLGIASDVVLTLTAMADVDLAGRRYVFDDRGSREEIFAPWSVRPMLVAGLSFTAAGPRPFEVGR